MSELVLSMTGIRRVYNQGRANEVRVLDGVDLNLRRGERVGLVAPSGAGKSTLLHIAGLLDQHDGGALHLAGEDTSGLSQSDKTRIRRDRVGFVYQFHHLLPEFSARENIALPQRAAGRSKAEAGRRADELLGRVGLSARADHRPAELSGGEQQRVAICRALANDPVLVLADEPTGNLDPDTAETVFDVLAELAQTTGLSALIATHNHMLADRLDRVVSLSGGVLTAG